jgi:hypothetical protein
MDRQDLHHAPAMPLGSDEWRLDHDWAASQRDTSLHVQEIPACVRARAMRMVMQRIV